MKIIMLAKEPVSIIDTIEADFIPGVGEMIVYKDGEPEEMIFLVEKILKPTLFKDGVKQYKVVMIPV